jgi:acyl dehydratase
MTTTAGESSQEGRITDEAIEAYRRRLGIPVRTRVRPHNEVATRDSIRHFAHGIGDDNPLYCDEAYATAGPWGGIIAPPMFAMSMGIPAEVEWTDAQREAMSGGDPLAGVGQYLCGERWLFARPIRPGLSFVKSTALQSVEKKKSEFGGGRGALLSHRHVHRTADGTPYVVNDRDFYHAERDATAKAGKYRDIERTVYTPQAIAEIDAAYAAEEVRGAEPRYFEEVTIGDTLGPMVKGPMTVTDIISYHIGWGWGMFGVGALKLAHRNRTRIPKFYPVNEYGVPDPAQRCHWDDTWAQELGQPMAYDYASMRMNWFANLATNWIGDAGWLWRFSGATTKFNYVGDTHWLTGRVTALRETDRTAEADIAMEGVNQRGAVTCTAEVTVLLPTRARPIVLIPDPTDEEVEFRESV